VPFDDGTFDLVTAFGVRHHTPDTALAIREVSRVLRPGGKTLTMFYHRNSFAYRALFPAKRMLQPAWRGKTTQEQVNAVAGPDNPLGKVYFRKQLRALLAGIERFESRTGAMFFRWAKLPPQPLRIWAELRWGWILYVKAQKPEL
jgi:SAM-dependent methyltransferase